MTLLIRTYSNPYKLDKENYWNLIRNSFHLCSSQTLVNGLCTQYDNFKIGQLTTFRVFLKHLYNEWDSNKSLIQQRAAVDNIITSYDFSKYCGNVLEEDNLKNSLRLNRTALCQSIRTLFELGVERNEAIPAELSIEQKCMFDVYEELQRTQNKAFILPHSFKEQDIDNAIDATIKYAIEHSHRNDDRGVKLSSINTKTIVIHGVHQFTPLMLRAIEELSKYKLVVLMFNYVPSFKSIYQTWLNVYEYFESIKELSPNDYTFKDTDTPGRSAANEIKALFEQDSSVSLNETSNISVLEFDNTTEFAGYIAKKYEDAENAQRDDEFRNANTLYYMNEQVYAADSSVNEILKIYFPRQFNERQFLDYPIGHFFISLTEMWDPETGALLVTDFDSLKECLSSGIIHEERPGELVSIFGKTVIALSNQNTITGMIKKLKQLKKLKADSFYSTGFDDKDASRIGYLNVSGNEIDTLIKGLNEFIKIADYFFADFNDESNDFKEFYLKISELLLDVLDSEELDDQFRSIVSRVLEQLGEVEDIEASATFDCLRETMQLYLQQIPLEGLGAHWIVRNFEQIDGDVLRKTAIGRGRTYHFACISDKDMISDRTIYSWPLDQFFFDHALNPVDWKYRVFITSKQEYKNFRRYALLYGLIFSQGDIKLSYIKNKDDEVQELYHVFRLLNAKVEKYVPERGRSYLPETSSINLQNEHNDVRFSQFDVMRFELCPARFLYESISTGGTVYKSDFLIIQYVKVLLERHARIVFASKGFAKNAAYHALNNELDQISSYLPFLTLSEKMDILRSVVDTLEKDVSRGKLKQGSKSKYRIALREEFLTDNARDKDGNEIFREIQQMEIDKLAEYETYENEYFDSKKNQTCKYCPEARYCLIPYMNKLENER